MPKGKGNPKGKQANNIARYPKQSAKKVGAPTKSALGPPRMQNSHRPQPKNLPGNVHGL